MLGGEILKFMNWIRFLFILFIIRFLFYLFIWYVFRKEKKKPKTKTKKQKNKKCKKSFWHRWQLSGLVWWLSLQAISNLNSCWHTRPGLFTVISLGQEFMIHLAKKKKKEFMIPSNVFNVYDCTKAFYLTKRKLETLSCTCFPTKFIRFSEWSVSVHVLGRRHFWERLWFRILKYWL